MSANVNIQGGRSARSGVMYALYGRGAQYLANVKRGTDRVAAYACSMGSLEAFIAYAEAQAAAHGRKYETYNLVLAGDPKVFDVNNPEDIQKVLDLSVGLTEAAFSAEYLIVAHDDALGGHAHCHIYVVNHDEITGKALKKNTSWVNGLHQLNDELLMLAGYPPNPSPAAPKPDWEQRREQFAPGGFEQELGDRVADALLDPRSIDREAFERVLDEHGVRLKVTDRDGWTYSMRREDNGKWGRKKASALTDEFTASGAQALFDHHKEKDQNHGTDRPSGAAVGPARVGRVDFGDVELARLAPRRHRAPEDKPDADHRAPERADEGNLGAVDLTGARATLDALARARREQADRDRDDDEDDRADRQRRPGSQDVQRTGGAGVRSHGVVDDERDEEVDRRDGFEFD